MNNRTDTLINNPVFIFCTFAFVILGAWWFSLRPLNTSDGLLHGKYIWGSCYQIIAFVGGIYGLIKAQKWGGFKSFLGRSIMFFSLGLLFQCIGQSVYSYYNLVAHIEAPYPSLGDLGYFGSVIFYILGVLSLVRVAGGKVSFKSMGNKFLAVLLPLILLVGSYLVFLQGYSFDWTNKLKIFLDFGYPLGQAFYVSIAILTLSIAQRFLGGLMKTPIILFLIALIVQYASDFNFLFQANKGTWYVGGIGDFLYMFSYLCMAIAIIFVGQVFEHIQDQKVELT